jgi:hypothetical protein
LDLASIANLIARYLHIVCSTLLVGGTLFYEMVVPVAIADLKPETQLAIFGRARWVFRQIVWASAFVLIVSGLINASRHWNTYGEGERVIERVGANGTVEYAKLPSVAARPGWWMVAHASAGTIAVVIALMLTVGGSPPGHPIQWMRVNLVILMTVIFLGSATRHVRLNLQDQNNPPVAVNVYQLPIVSTTEPAEADDTATAHGAAPTTQGSHP